MVHMKRPVLVYTMLILCITACTNPKANNKVTSVDYIRAIPGEDEDIPEKTIQRGKVLIAYADCYTCHKEEKRSFGPAFKDVARRYPANAVFIQMLAQKIITGGRCSWGNAVMAAHPKLSVTDAADMAAYILSLE